MESAVTTVVFQKVVAAIRQTTRIEASAISETTRFTDDLGFGRFTRIRFALSLEDMFDLELSDEAVERFATVGDVVRYFSRRYFRDVEQPAMRVAA